MKNQEKPATQDQKPFNAKKLAVSAGVLIAVFLIGYVPSSMSARNAQERNTRLQYNLSLADLRGQLGMASYEANRNNYANAAQRSTDFFTGLREAINNSGDATLKQNFERILASRDAITSDIAETNPAVKEKLAQAYADFFWVTAAQQSQEKHH